MKIESFMRFGLTAFCLFYVPGHRAFANDFDRTMQIVGRHTKGLETPVNQLVTPAGTQVELRGVRPNALALAPNGRCLVTSGLKAQLIVVDPATGKIRQHVPLPPDDKLPASAPASATILNPKKGDKLSLTGLAFSPDGSRIYLSNVNGDIKVFGVGKNHKVVALFSLPLPPAKAPGRTAAIPTGLAVSADGKRLYVALNLSDRLAELDAASGKVLRLWNVGVAPYDVVLCRNKIYVSNWGGRQPDAHSVKGPAGRGTWVRVDSRAIASEGSVSVIDLNSGSAGKMPLLPERDILTGRHACALALSPNKKFLVCANAGDDTVSVIDTRSDKIVETICTRQNPADLFGAQPDALAFDKHGRRLFVCNATQNAVAVFKFKPGQSKLLGLIPVGWFPGAIAYDARRKRIDVANIKNIGSGRPGPAGETEFNSQQYEGSLSLVPLPSAKALAAFTRTARADLRYPLLAEAKLPPRPGQPARPVPERVGEPSVFRHVIYVIKENRTYDQVLGDVKEGNGDANLCTFGERVTPNQHKLVRDFVLLDNTYCCGILSADGHEWADAAITTDYMEREFAGWPRSYAADSLVYSPAGFIWNDAVAHGKTVTDFGEFSHGEAAWKNPARKGKPDFLDCYRDFVSGSNAVVYSEGPDISALKPYLVAHYPGFDLQVPDVVRAAHFIQALKQFEAADDFPDLVIVWLPNDHTSGTRFGSPTPAAQVADNDRAFGELVDAVSHSRFWTNTCIFAVEDDPQDGWDHVSGYRTTAYIVSPYTKRHAVVSTQYNQTSLLRTIELILGLPPLNQMDATATPMFDCFTNRPDFAPFNAVMNRVPLDEMNPRPAQIKNRQLRRDANASARLPLDKEDQCPEDLFNHILWRAAKGTQTPYPDWAVQSDED